MSATSSTRGSDDAARLNRSVFSLAERLATRDIVVARIEVQWALYGSWELWLQVGAVRDRYDPTILKGSHYHVPAPDTVRYIWDGRDGVLCIQVSTGQRLEAPSNWIANGNLRFDSHELAIKFVEEHAKADLHADA